MKFLVSHVLTLEQVLFEDEQEGTPVLGTCSLLFFIT
jgi:hypothetical protein